jgi:hypothetical protein
MDDAILDELEAYARALPEAKHEPQYEPEAIANWLHDQSPERRDAVLESLPVWFESTDPWKPLIAIEVAVLLGNASLVDEAIAIAGHSDHPAEETSRVTFRLALIAAIKRVSTEAGLAYLSRLAGEVGVDASEDRILSARAQLALCFLAAEPQLACLDLLVERVRKWQDSRVARSVFGALDVWAAEAGLPIERLLTVSEQRLVRLP